VHTTTAIATSFSSVAKFQHLATLDGWPALPNELIPKVISALSSAVATHSACLARTGYAYLDRLRQCAGVVF
jgi:hypothetical protein